MMFDLPHFRNYPCSFDQRVGSIATRENQLNLFGTLFDEANCSLQGYQFAMDAVVNFIDNDEIVFLTDMTASKLSISAASAVRIATTCSGMWRLLDRIQSLFTFSEVKLRFKSSQTA